MYGVGASACHSGAVASLIAAKGRPQGVPFALAIKSAQEAADYLPEMNSLARRLARRCWPGPVTLVLDDAHEQGLATQLPESVQQAVCPNGTLGLRVAAGGALLEVLQMLAGPIVLTSANRSGSPDAVTATQVVEAMGDDVALVLDDGPCRYGQPSSVVRVHRDRLEVLREGVVAESTLHRLTSVLVLLVCTGNTCRSPMAELLMRRELAQHLNCDEQNLEQHGVLVQSAGIAAAMGSPPSTEAVRVMEEMGMDLRGHESRTLPDQLVRHADLILTMTSGHFDAIVAHWPEAADKTWEVVYHLMRTGVTDPAAIEGVVQPNITDSDALTGADVPMEIQISISLPDTREPMVASVQDIWVGADWNEKETWDLVGIDFEGHEGMRRVLNPHETPVGYHPLQKQHKLRYHGFEEMYDDAQGFMRKPADAGKIK